jgi:hypothetical protein
MALDPMRPTDEIDYGIRWQRWLETGETITSSSWTAPAGITVQSDSNNTTETKVVLTGGTPGTDYIIWNEVVTSLGRTASDFIVVPVRG